MVNRAFFITWQFLEPLLFGLIGAEVNIEFINASLIGRGIVVITCGLIVRVIISIVVVSGNGFNLMERIFIGAAWVPKATVQILQLIAILEKVLKVSVEKF
jgi:Kef-type K+ transport system membrane component KefB